MSSKIQKSQKAKGVLQRLKGTAGPGNGHREYAWTRLGLYLAIRELEAGNGFDPALTNRHCGTPAGPLSPAQGDLSGGRASPRPARLYRSRIIGGSTRLWHIDADPADLLERLADVFPSEDWMENMDILIAVLSRAEELQLLKGHSALATAAGYAIFAEYLSGRVMLGTWEREDLCTAAAGAMRTAYNELWLARFQFTGLVRGRSVVDLPRPFDKLGRPGNAVFERIDGEEAPRPPVSMTHARLQSIAARGLSKLRGVHMMGNEQASRKRALSESEEDQDDRASKRTRIDGKPSGPPTTPLSTYTLAGVCFAGITNQEVGHASLGECYCGVRVL